MSASSSSALLLSLGATLAYPAHAALGPLQRLPAQEGRLSGQILTDPLAPGVAPQLSLADGTRYGLPAASPAAGALSLSLTPDGDGRWRVGVEGPAPARGETLRFAVELSWEGGRWVRAYTVRTRPAPPADGATSTPAARSHMVRRGDTLLALAKRYYPARPAQAARAIFRANTHAFAGDNPDMLLAGATLRLPATLPAAATAQQAAAKAARPAALPVPAQPPRAAVRATPLAATAAKATPAETLPSSPPPEKPAPAPDAPTTPAQPPQTAAGDAAAAQATESGARPVADAQAAERRQAMLSEAKRRLAALEAEVARLQAAPPPPSPGTDDALLDAAVIDYVTTGAGGLAALSLLAWQLARRRARKGTA